MSRLKAHTLNEGRYHLKVTPCPQCDRGHWEIDKIDRSRTEPSRVDFAAHCSRCGLERTFAFTIEYEIPQRGPESECINPGREPSRIIDLGQWRSLFALLIELSDRAESKVEARRTGFQAALCLAEALKFYDDDDENDLPPRSAFFSEETAETFREHPAKFSRQALRDMQGRLPSLNTMAENVRRDARDARKRRWRFWKK